LAPPLNRPDLQGKKDANSPADPAEKAAQFKRVFYTITCGRVGKAMPTWGQTQGGPLNSEQIKQLATMINEGTAWDEAKDYATNGAPEFNVHGDATDHLSLADPLDASATTVVLNTVDVLAKGDRLQIGDELLGVTDVDKGAHSVTVERPVGTTKAAAHDANAQVLKVPVPPDPPAVTGKDSPLPCGQILPPEQAAATPAGTAVVSATLTLVAENTLLDKAALAAPAGQQVTVTYDNKDAGIAHNIHFFRGSDATGDEVAQTDIANGPVTQTLTFGPLDAGQFYYQCDIHPGPMNGTLTVQ